MGEKRLLKGKRVLLVDDEADVLDSLGELLHVCQVVKAGSFDEAKECLETRYFNLAVLDIMGVDGYRLADICRERDVIAVMLTAHALSPEDVVKSYKRGAASYLPKEQIGNIAAYLEEILEAHERGENLWIRWLDRWGAFYEKKFGADWQEHDREFWEKFPHVGPF